MYYRNPEKLMELEIQNLKKAAAIQNKRIVSNNIIPALMERKKDLLEKAENLKKAIEKVPEWMEQIEKIKKENNALYREIPYEIREYHNMSIKYY